MSKPGILAEFARIVGAPVVFERVENIAGMRTGYHGYNRVRIEDPKAVNHGYVVGSFWLAYLPGCCGVCVLTKVASPQPNRGIGTLLHILAEQIAYKDGFRQLIATTRADEPYEIKILDNLGYTKFNDFQNHRTGNHVLMYHKDISPVSDYSMNITLIDPTTGVAAYSILTTI